MHKLAMFIYVLLPTVIVGILCRVMWIEWVCPELVVYVILALYLAINAFMFLQSAYCLLHKYERVQGKLHALDSMDAVTFRTVFGSDIEDINPSKVCIAKYTVNGANQYALVENYRIFGIAPGKKTTLFVKVHKIGVRTEYQVSTKMALLRDLFIGIPFAIETIAWVGIPILIKICS